MIDLNFNVFIYFMILEKSPFLYNDRINRILEKHLNQSVEAQN